MSQPQYTTTGKPPFSFYLLMSAFFSLVSIGKIAGIALFVLPIVYLFSFNVLFVDFVFALGIIPLFLVNVYIMAQIDYAYASSSRGAIANAVCAVATIVARMLAVTLVYVPIGWLFHQSAKFFTIIAIIALLITIQDELKARRSALNTSYSAYFSNEQYGQKAQRYGYRFGDQNQYLVQYWDDDESQSSSSEPRYNASQTEGYRSAGNAHAANGSTVNTSDGEPTLIEPEVLDVSDDVIQDSDSDFHSRKDF